MSTEFMRRLFIYAYLVIMGAGSTSLRDEQGFSVVLDPCLTSGLPIKLPSCSFLDTSLIKSN